MFDDPSSRNREPGINPATEAPGATRKGKRPSPPGASPACSTCARLIALLNELKGAKFAGSGTALPMVHARHLEFGEQACERVIRIKVWKWLGTEREDYLRPETLFRPTKFDAYRNEGPPRPLPARKVDPHSPADAAEERRRKEAYDRITPERRAAGISYARHAIWQTEKTLDEARMYLKGPFGNVVTAAKRDVDALSKKLEELRIELAFLEAGKEEETG